MDSGDTFRRDYGSHLWVVVSDPSKDAEHVVIVSMTTIRRFHDPACVLSMGDHPFVRHATYVNYRNCRVVANSQLDAQHAAGQLILEQRAGDELLERIRQGAAQSEFTPFEALELLKQQGLVEP